VGAIGPELPCGVSPLIIMVYSLGPTATGLGRGGGAGGGAPDEGGGGGGVLKRST